MKAIKNVLNDILFQFRIKGALRKRLTLVFQYYFYYARSRRKGLSQGDSRLKSYEILAKKGVLGRNVSVRCRPQRWMELDILSSWLVVKEVLFDGMYFMVDGFCPRPGQVVVDVGAHQGIYTLEAADLVGPQGRVIAVEASPRSFALLSRNVAANEFRWVSPVHAAVMDYDGRVTFHLSRLVSGWNSAVLPTDGSATESEDVEVPAETLDSILRRMGAPKPNLIKIDAEGACAKILKGASQTLQARPRLVMEVEGGESEINDVVSLLTSRGYRITRFGGIVYAEYDSSLAH